MNTPRPPTRFAFGLAAIAAALVVMVGCERRPTDVPPPTSSVSSSAPSAGATGK